MSAVADHITGYLEIPRAFTDKPLEVTSPDSSLRLWRPAPHCRACARAILAHARGTERRKMASPSFPTPLHGHVGRGAFSNVYEPAEDTFLLLDALEAAAAELKGCEGGKGPRGRGLGRPGEMVLKESQGKEGCCLPRGGGVRILGEH